MISRRRITFRRSKVFVSPQLDPLLSSSLADLAVIALKIVKKGDGEIEGVTTDNKPRRLGPKRASYIRKVFALRKKDDVRKYVVRREVKKGDKTFYKSPKI